jgi:hypothetical protein
MKQVGNVFVQEDEDPEGEYLPGWYFDSDEDFLEGPFTTYDEAVHWRQDFLEAQDND